MVGTSNKSDPKMAIDAIQAANWVETEMLAKLPGDHWISLAQAENMFFFSVFQKSGTNDGKMMFFFRFFWWEKIWGKYDEPLGKLT